MTLHIMDRSGHTTKPDLTNMEEFEKAIEDTPITPATIYFDAENKEQISDIETVIGTGTEVIAVSPFAGG